MSQAERQKRYYERHPEAAERNNRLTAARHKARRESDPEGALAPGRKYYARNREARIADTQRRAERNRVILHEAKSKPCADCGVQYPPCVMDLDHVRGKKDKCVGSMLTYSVERLRAEIAKCDVRCANCHRLKSNAGAK